MIKNAVMTGVALLLAAMADGVKASSPSIFFRGIESGSVLFLNFDDYYPHVYQATYSEFNFGVESSSSPASVVWDKFSLEPNRLGELGQGYLGSGAMRASFLANQSHFEYSVSGSPYSSEIFHSKLVSADFEYEFIDAEGRSVIKSDHVTAMLQYRDFVGQIRIEHNALSLASGIDFSTDGWGESYFNKLGTQKAEFQASFSWVGYLDVSESFSNILNSGGLRLSSGDSCIWMTQCSDRAFEALQRDSQTGNSFSELMIIESVNGVAVIPIPEPETYAMMLAGLGLLGLARRRKQNG